MDCAEPEGKVKFLDPHGALKRVGTDRENGFGQRRRFKVVALVERGLSDRSELFPQVDRPKIFTIRKGIFANGVNGLRKGDLGQSFRIFKGAVVDFYDFLVFDCIGQHEFLRRASISSNRNGCAKTLEPDDSAVLGKSVGAKFLGLREKGVKIEFW